jgi:hypothetical protein
LTIEKVHASGDAAKAGSQAHLRRQSIEETDSNEEYQFFAQNLPRTLCLGANERCLAFLPSYLGDR